MHGFIFLEFEKYIFTSHGFPVWRRVRQQAGLQDREYAAVASYPDEEIFALVHAAVMETGLDAPELLRQFGVFLVPNLLKVYKAYIDPSWKTMDLLEHTETTMHPAVRNHDKATSPPILEINRISPRELTIHYRSTRRMEAMAVGIIEGIAAFYHEEDRIFINLIPNEAGQTSRIEVSYR